MIQGHHKGNGMRRIFTVMAITVLAGGCSALPPSGTQNDHRVENAAGQKMEHEKSFFVARKGIEDDYVVIFHVMPAPEGEGYSREYYHLMVSIVRDGKPLTNLRVYSEVKHPDGSLEKKELMVQLGKWYMARYKLSHEQGRHQITVTFERSGKKYFSGIYYPEFLPR